MQATDVDRSIDGFLVLAKKLRTSRNSNRFRTGSWSSERGCFSVPNSTVTDRTQTDDLIADEAEPADVEFTFGWD